MSGGRRGGTALRRRGACRLHVGMIVSPEWATQAGPRPETRAVRVPSPRRCATSRTGGSSSAELARAGEIDRTERIDTLYVQRGVELEPVAGDFSASAWHAEGGGEHSVAHQVEACARWEAAGGTAIGAFAGDRLSGSASSCRTSAPARAARVPPRERRFYRGRGFEPTAAALPELYALEPEDVHLEKRL